jgi:hypothetical protein
MMLEKNTLRVAIASIFAAGLLAGCGGGGDVKLSADSSTVINDNSTTIGGGGGAENPCANYTDPVTNTVKRGRYDAPNCIYNADFVSEDNPLLVSVTIPFISGVHIFEDSLHVGRDVDGSNPNEFPPAAGAGPTLTIRAGNRLAWLQSSDYLLINRGARIIAEGSPAAPIVMSGFADLVLGSAGKFDTQLWGGVVINGNGITNKCNDAQRANRTCNIQAEGKPSFYGGNANDESSGVMRYVVVKHPGFEVAPGDELNGITLNAVGSGTVLDHIQVYSTYDDGVEFFGGAVSVDNLVALYVQDDSIDWADGWAGSVNRALIIQGPQVGDRCIEADNIGEDFNTPPLSNGTVTNMTCIMSGARGPISFHGDSMGAEMRRGTLFSVQDSIFYDGYAVNQLSQSATRCFRISNTETLQRAQTGLSSVQSTVIACQTPTTGVLANGDTVAQWITNTGTGAYPLNTNNRIFGGATSASAQILNGFFTRPQSQFRDPDGNPFTVDRVNGDLPLGAVDQTNNWTATWTFGLNDLWF